LQNDFFNLGLDAFKGNQFFDKKGLDQAKFG
jgi:hypothetical protein